MDDEDLSTGLKIFCILWLIVILLMGIFEAVIFGIAFFGADKVSCNLVWCTFTTERRTIEENTIEEHTQIISSNTNVSRKCYSNNKEVNCSVLNLSRWFDE